MAGITTAGIEHQGRVADALPRILVVDDDLDALRQLMDTATRRDDRFYLNGCELLFGVYGRDPQTPANWHAEQFTQLSAVIDYATDPKNRIDGIVSDLYEFDPYSIAAEHSDYAPEDELAPEMSSMAEFGWPLAIMGKAAGLPVAIHSEVLDDPYIQRPDLRRQAVVFGAIGAYEKGDFASNDRRSALVAVREEVFKRRGAAQGGPAPG